ncbi:unnamed protein product [Closterium sp. NIES-53]
MRAACGDLYVLPDWPSPIYLTASCSCRILSHQTPLWHHRLGHPSLPRLRSMHSRLLVSGLPRSLPSLPRLPTPPCLPCVEGRQRATPHSSEFHPTTAPLQTLHMYVWGPALSVERTRSATFCCRGGEFSSNLLAEFSRDEGIRQLFTLPAFPQQNGIAERRIGLIMEVARTSMIHVVATHFLWPFAVRYAAHPLNLWPHGVLSLVRDTNVTSSPLALFATSSFASPPTPSRGSSTTRTSIDSSPPRTSPLTSVSVSTGFTRTRPTRSPSHLSFGYQSPPPDDPLPPQGPAPSGVSQVDPPPLVKPLEISSDSSGPAEGGDPAADDTAATRRSPRLEPPPGFPPRLSSPPPQPAAVDSGAETGGAEPRGAETEGEGFGGCCDWGCWFWGC